MVADEQTHALPSDRDALERFARFAGSHDRDAFGQAMLVHLRNVQRHAATLLEIAPAIEAGRRRFLFPSESDDRETLDGLAEMGFRRPPEISALVRGWQMGSYGSLKSPFARGQFAEVVPVLLEHFARSADPAKPVLAFHPFLAGLHALGPLFSLLRHNPELLPLMPLMLGTAP